MLISVDQSVEWELARETELLGKNLPQYLFVHHKSHMKWSGIEPEPPQWAAGDWQPNYGTAIRKVTTVSQKIFRKALANVVMDTLLPLVASKMALKT
jgi:hypothetical protein